MQQTATKVTSCKHTGNTIHVWYRLVGFENTFVASYIYKIPQKATIDGIGIGCTYPFTLANMEAAAIP